jgi:subtilisin family serine protease
MRTLPAGRTRTSVSLAFLAVLLCLSACRSQLPTSTPTFTVPPLSTPALAISPSATGSPTATQTPFPTFAFPKIDRQPAVVTMEDWAPWAGRTLTATLSYDPTSLDLWQMDYRTQDLSQLDLRYALNDLLAAATFDDRTIWPPANKLPFGFDPRRILETGKDPGLGVRALHTRGITGQGVGIAIIDQPLLVDHQEYRDQLRLYEEFFFHNSANQQIASMHGGAVASLAVGKSIGVAPEADLYFIAADLASGKDASGNYLYDFTEVAQAVRRILEINQQLPSDRKIRVISMSFGWASRYAGYEALSAAVAEARLQGVFIVSAYPAMEQVYGFKLYGLERQPLFDPDLFVSYSRTQFCAIYADRFPPCQAGTLLVPSSSRTAASPMGEDEYVFYRMGGESWTMPYIAGMYALAAQVDPQITPERFWELALQTGRTLDISGSSGSFQVGPILDPTGLIEAVGKEAGNR